MKKIILLFAIIFSFTAKAQLATKTLDVDTISGLSQQVNIWQFTADAKARKITVVYDVNLIYPSGIAKIQIPNGVYIIQGAAYDAYDASQLGVSIKGLFAGDLTPMTKVSDLPKLQK